ncbi:LacI family DNA-binding transcriptional regulator [Kribbella capetownensis]|uniref:LacI family DNA-binding transcriptional regulator n=1 Tax=Kribbella capetownensis TaxID=1572659 RepID=UPI0013F3DB51|nr:LacI family DNA-binding transcriptional regulator [Kribbella capetownensis]
MVWTGPQTRPRQTDVARAAGVSQATVSSVLNGQASGRRIPPETIEKVERAIRTLGYVPDVIARSLQGMSNQLLGVHTYESMFPIDHHDYYQPFLLGIEEEAEAAGYDLVLFTSTRDEEGVRRVYKNGTNRLKVADGCIFVGIRVDKAELRRLAAEDYPFVFIGKRDIPGIDLHFVTGNYADSTAQVVHTLADLGHVRIGHLQQRDRDEPRQDLARGRRRGLADRGLPAVRPVVAEPGAIGPTTLRGLLDSRLTAVLVDNAVQAAALGKAARAAKLRIPADLSVVVLQDTPPPNPQRSARDWTCLRMPRVELGRLGVRLLLSLLNGSAGTAPLVAQCGFHPGATIGRPRTI